MKRKMIKENLEDGLMNNKLEREEDEEEEVEDFIPFKVDNKKREGKSLSSKEKKQIGNLFGVYKDKSKGDSRVALGLYGDSENGWRERYRVEKLPSFVAKPTDMSKTKRKYK